ncbi:MAG: DUF5687 family protein [Prevotellaceae bacterium]|jgi:hypothetical protein|nr:DUF5687 family protein [Prevotellaceae bacterium]
MNLFLELRRHGKLAEKRNPMFEKNKFGKFWIYLMGFFWAGYLIFIGVMLAKLFEDSSREPYHYLNAALIFIFALDFLMRFAFQKPPTQEVKPYLLMPIRRQRLIDFLLIRSGLNGYNILWLFLFVPFALLTITKFYGLWGVFTYCFGIWMLALINNYWYLLCRTLMEERIWWLALPIVVYTGIALVIFLPFPNDSPLFDWSVMLGEGLIQGHWATFLPTALVIVLLWMVNRTLMGKLIYNELSKVEDTKVKHLSEYKFLDRYGELGEYIRLELKLLLRNKMPKTSLRMIIILVVIFSLLLSFTEVYDGTGMRSFIVIYNFVIFGILFLSTIMGYEGNYIDGLMSRKESIYTLLRAKYTLYSLAMLIPFILMIPTIVMGKLSLLTCASWAIFTSGCVFFCMFQLAVYNDKTIPLNTKVSARRNTGTGLQNLITGCALGVPLLANFILASFISQTILSWILIVIGAGFIFTSDLWLKNIYHRFMARRYKNMEGFRDSRE